MLAGARGATEVTGVGEVCRVADAVGVRSSVRDETDVASCCPEVTDGVECSTDRSAEGGRDELLCRGYVGVTSSGTFPYDRSHEGEEPDAPDDDARWGHALLDKDCSVNSCDGVSPG